VKRKKSTVWVLALALTISAGLNFWWWNGYREEMRVIHVLDGDTFTLRKGVRVRLIGANAPEYDACLGTEATEKLSALVLDKVVKLQNEKWDRWGRKMALVMADGKLVDAEMIRSGFAVAEYPEEKVNRILRQAQDEAKAAERGVFGTKCNQKVNSENIDCNIKGNWDKTKWTKKYYLPECPHYNTVKVNLAAGDKWFCNEKEASGSGFFMAEDCI
jgi:endonuclease YncB( thermonuclease family)